MFRPTLERKGLNHVLFKAEEWGLTIPPQVSRPWDDNLLNRVLQQDDWQQWLAKPVPIRRAWGPVGLLWSLLIDRLGARRSFTVCELCDRIIAGKDGKRFCGKMTRSSVLIVGGRLTNGGPATVARSRQEGSAKGIP
jgi:hypothetical protein